MTKLQTPAISPPGRTPPTIAGSVTRAGMKAKVTSSSKSRSGEIRYWRIAWMPTSTAIVRVTILGRLKIGCRAGVADSGGLLIAPGD